MAPRRQKIQVETDKTFDLGQQIGELRGIVVTGFQGVHARQDITNGRIGKVEDRVAILEQDSSTSKGRRQGTWRLWVVLAAIATIIINLLELMARTGCWTLFCK